MKSWSSSFDGPRPGLLFWLSLAPGGVSSSATGGSEMMVADSWDAISLLWGLV